ncbi:MAG: hypothetical protein HY287_12325 [Planctomycetes bacterium]|nr:hypothetical protein [Planctomycetota bacterium]
MRNWQRRRVMIEAVLFTFAAAAIGAERPDGVKPPVPRSRQIDPDLGDQLPAREPTEGGVSDVTAATNCATIGSYTLPASGTNRFRGNSYRIDVQSRLTAVQMELAFAGTTNLYVSIFQRQQDGSYIRYSGWPANDVVITNAVGQGTSTPKFYTTENGTPSISSSGVLLEPGDYAIGFAWSPSITYARDNDFYPQDFSRGQILGLLSVNGVTLPVSATTDFGDPFTGGAYSMQLCFQPVAGACCSVFQFGSEGCRDVPPDQCNASDAVFHGELTSCANTPCNFGACCDSCGHCIGDELAPEACTNRGGVTHWPSISCPASGSQQEQDLCPKTTGACCRNEHCDVKCKPDCDAIGGTYGGDGTTCTPNKCQGACCIGGLGCFDKTSVHCSGLNGTYHGDGTACATEDCNGACCVTQGTDHTCIPNSTREACFAFGPPPNRTPNGLVGAVFNGEATDCPFPTCIGGTNDGSVCNFDPQQGPLCSGGGTCDFCHVANAGSCCLPDGTCVNTIKTTCDSALGADSSVSGAFVANAQCIQFTCNIGRCCFADAVGSCERLTSAACAASGGSFDGSRTDCPAGACSANIPKGACCGTTAGDCTTVTKANCTSNRVYAGDGTSCGTAGICPGFGACCQPNSANPCQDKVTRSYCELINGSDIYYNGDTTTCQDPDVSCDQRGSCCTADACLNVLESDCNALVPPGHFKGARSSCDQCNLRDSCCRLDGTCQDNVLQSECSGPGEIYGTNGSSDVCFVTFGCSPRGACCTPDGQCLDAQSSADCSGVQGALYAGDGSTCDQNANLCKIGACCNDSSPQTACVETSYLACHNNGLAYRGPGTSCDDALCGMGACCQLNNPTCTPRTQAACVAISGASFSGYGKACETDTCVQSACCVPSSSQCQSRTRQSCELVGGSYLVAATCSTGSCNFCTQSIKSSDPATCEIDARQPHDPTNASIRQGLQSIQITFTCDTAGLTSADLVVTSTGGSANPAPTPPAIDHITKSGSALTVFLDVPIPDGGYTCVTHVPSQTFVCFGSLPGDVDGNRIVAAADICSLVGDFGGINESTICTTVTVPALTLDKCDLDRSGTCTPLDILTAIDLFSGAQAFSVWKDATLPTCPTPGP